jgi:hypothetical protein
MKARAEHFVAWRDEAVKAGQTITRIVVAFEAGRDGFWLGGKALQHGPDPDDLPTKEFSVV